MRQRIKFRVVTIFLVLLLAIVHNVAKTPLGDSVQRAVRADFAVAEPPVPLVGDRVRFMMRPVYYSIAATNNGTG